MHELKLKLESEFRKLVLTFFSSYSKIEFETNLFEPELEVNAQLKFEPGLEPKLELDHEPKPELGKLALTVF